MTNEEVIANINMIRVAFVDPVTKEQRKLIDDTLDMAIKALEQQPCDDAISRKAVIKGIEELKKSSWATANRSHGYEYLITEALDVVKDLCVKQLPSVTQKSETVTEFADRCRECGKMRKGHWIWNFDKGYCKCSECGIGMGHKEFDYCPNCGAKMQESEDKE